MSVSMNPQSMSPCRSAAWSCFGIRRISHRPPERCSVGACLRQFCRNVISVPVSKPEFRRLNAIPHGSLLSGVARMQRPLTNRFCHLDTFLPQLFTCIVADGCAMRNANADLNCAHWLFQNHCGQTPVGVEYCGQFMHRSTRTSHCENA